MTNPRIQKAARPAPIMTFFGEAGRGKTTLACSFPNPIVIQAEEGVHRISNKIAAPDVLPFTSVRQLWDDLKWLMNEEHDYKTVIIDSVTTLSEHFVADVIARDPDAKSINKAHGGWGVGWSMVEAMHSRVRNAAKMLRDKRGMATIFIAHADLEKMDLPDKDDYSRYSLRMHKKSTTHYIDNVDLVGLIRLQSAVRGGDDEKKKIVTSGDRELICCATENSVAKNGYGIDEPIDLVEGENPLLNIVWHEPIEAVKKEEE